ncbi:hypothetical protein LARV_03883 [Longilinea arvoryzae]|uniref:Uncharacterized protein n=1 Tax=Longilinea arvoryzae TaxID=360412 RepID=A0A0K8MZL4_9CHLR|nr:hypothetical protein [Longilinea arvoryzae]GAP16087.1 hypothetical protein LARV_03883 [Longilinea arvoryzae]
MTDLNLKLEALERIQAQAHLTPREQARRRREREHTRARREQRVTYDLPPVLRRRLQALGEELRIPASQLAALAIGRFLNDYTAGAVDLGAYKQPSRSPRYDWNLHLPNEIIRGRRKKAVSD